jgi:hypothetical protein
MSNDTGDPSISANEQRINGEAQRKEDESCQHEQRDIGFGGGYPRDRYPNSIKSL